MTTFTTVTMTLRHRQTGAMETVRAHTTHVSAVRVPQGYRLVGWMATPYQPYRN